VDEWHGTNAFIRDGDRVFRTYFINNRGDEALGGTWSYPRPDRARAAGGVGGLARGYPQTRPYEWWNWHDEYSDAQPAPGWLAKIAEAGAGDTSRVQGTDALDPADPQPRPASAECCSG